MNRPKFTEETILSVAKTTLANARSHLTALGEFGVTEAMLNEFEVNIQTAEALPDEVSNRIDLKSLTQEKADSLDVCYQWGRKLRTRLQLAFGNNSPQAKSFPSKQFNAAINSESKMMPVMEILINLATQYQTELAAQGQTPEILAQGSQLLESLREADQAQELKKDEKRSATQERYQKFQIIYDTTNRINKIGRLVFENDPINLPLFESKWPVSTVTPPPENPE
ncbi:MAG: hypothetical protein HUU32_04680 [Calditrichaceae bacterium]|nr:hypothetical protein [Calditrichia bacterium]NUQ40669.1 hypothetical protein [Calditrichaceae bacterium]